MSDMCFVAVARDADDFQERITRVLVFTELEAHVSDIGQDTNSLGLGCRRKSRLEVFQPLPQTPTKSDRDAEPVAGVRLEVGPADTSAPFDEPLVQQLGAGKIASLLDQKTMPVATREHRVPHPQPLTNLNAGTKVDGRLLKIAE